MSVVSGKLICEGTRTEIREKNKKKVQEKTLLVKVKSWDYPCPSDFISFKYCAMQITVHDGLKTMIFGIVTSMGWIAIECYVYNRLSRVGWVVFLTWTVTR